MAIIRPVSDMQRKSREIAQLAKDTKEPIFLTKNGAEHLVLIDSDEFEKYAKSYYGSAAQKAKRD